MSYQVTVILCAVYLTFFSFLHCKEYLVEVEDFQKLDEKITFFLKNPSKEGWDDNLADIEFFDNSMKDMIKKLNATFDGLTKDYFRKAEKFAHSGKPLFIDTSVAEYEIQPLIKVTDDELKKLYWLRVDSEKDWELLGDMVRLKKQVEIILP